MYEQVSIGLVFTSDWPREWREIFELITERSKTKQSKPRITLDTLPIVLIVLIINSLDIRPSWNKTAVHSLEAGGGGVAGGVGGGVGGGGVGAGVLHDATYKNKQKEIHLLEKVIPLYHQNDNIKSATKCDIHLDKLLKK